MRKIILVFIFLISISFVLAQSIPKPHGFYGYIFYSDGTPIQENLEISAKINNFSDNSIINNGKYEDLVVESETSGTIYFYLGGLDNPIGNYTFQSFEITELNFTTNLINPSSETQNDDDSGSQGSTSGGSSRSSGGSISSLPTINESASSSEENTTQTQENEEQEIVSPGMTGAVIGFLKSGEGIASLITFILIVILLIGVVVLKKKSPKNE